MTPNLDTIDSDRQTGRKRERQTGGETGRGQKRKAELESERVEFSTDVRRRTSGEQK